ncbi:MAG TPA: DUF397 domain-containing protein [Pseudonocardiaceae bacterium]|nr:DUF397 domain-containing protein [Pseudonocardiaceae bacterium]
MHKTDFEHWHKSSYSEGGMNSGCVEVGRATHAVGVRDTKARAAGLLAFNADAWAGFVRDLDDDTRDR